MRTPLKGFLLIADRKSYAKDSKVRSPTAGRSPSHPHPQEAI